VSEEKIILNLLLINKKVMPKVKIPQKDLTKEAPRSPHTRLGGFVILARAIDKCRATLARENGEYEFNCPLDSMLFSFKDVKGDDFKKFVATGASDEEIVKWVKKNGAPKSSVEIKRWSDTTEKENYENETEDKKWLEAQNKKLGLPKDGTLFDYLDADDKASFSGGSNVCL